MFQVMVIARNKRLAECFLVFCDADYYKNVASFIRTFNPPVGVISLKFFNPLTNTGSYMTHDC